MGLCLERQRCRKITLEASMVSWGMGQGVIKLNQKVQYF